MKPDETWNGKLHADLYKEAAKEVDPEKDPAAHSQLFRELLKKRFYGQLPCSLWPYNGSHNWEDPAAEGRNALGYGSEPGKEKDLYGAQKEAGGRLSTFEGALARGCLELWSNEGDLVLDPFAGRGARLHATLHSGRDYVGFDTSDDALLACERAAQGFDESRFALYHSSSLFLSDYLPPESTDFVFTCPPYWNSEFYGDNGHGSEAAPTYRAFVEELCAVLLLAAETLKEERYLCLVLRGFFLHGHFHDTPAHVAEVLCASGLLLHDKVAKKMGSSRERFHQDVAKLRRTAQVHEEVLVFKKTKVRKGKRRERELVMEKNKRRLLEEQHLAARRSDVLARFGAHPRPSLPYEEDV